MVVMSGISTIPVVRPDQFDVGTAQPPGSERRAAIAPELGVESALWGGTFEVEPGARTGVHHHECQHTIAYVLSGTCEIRCGEKGEFAAHARPGDFIHVPACLPASYGDQSVEGTDVSLDRRAQHAGPDRRQSAEYPLAVIRMGTRSDGHHLGIAAATRQSILPSFRFDSLPWSTDHTEVSVFLAVCSPS
jgi:uncharacterized RmlC-like cupin family protein